MSLFASRCCLQHIVHLPAPFIKTDCNEPFSLSWLWLIDLRTILFFHWLPRRSSPLNNQLKFRPRFMSCLHSLGYGIRHSVTRIFNGHSSWKHRPPIFILDKLYLNPWPLGSGCVTLLTGPCALVLCSFQVHFFQVHIWPVINTIFLWHWSVWRQYLCRLLIENCVHIDLINMANRYLMKM
jgi:hypothetical protein